MSVVVWDGYSLAADRQATNGGTISSITKIKKIDNHLYGFVGSFDRSQILMAWVEAGKDPQEWPEFQSEEDSVYMIEITPDKKIFKYEREPIPFHVEELQAAIGCGKAFAYGALYMGATSVQAVEAASEFDIHCGKGVDLIRLDDVPNNEKTTKEKVIKLRS
mgnify:CR=1 FL=1|tara:strand:- start:984 stop:1469 length:486 start_codon:yes stop_codon:yes gene_type:complete